MEVFVYGRLYGKKHKQRLSLFAKQHTERHFKSGEENPMYGKHLPDEHKQALSDANSKTWIVTLPDGSETTFKSLRKFCQQHDINYTMLKTCPEKTNNVRDTTSRSNRNNDVPVLLS